MAVTRTVKQAKEGDLPEGVGFLSDGTDGYGHGEQIPISAQRTLTVTKPIQFDQLAFELEQEIGQPVYLASFQPPSRDDRVGPVPGSKDYPITIYVRCADSSEAVDKSILKVLEAHRADPAWQDPGLQ